MLLVIKNESPSRGQQRLKLVDLVDKENGNYDYLMYADIDFKHPEVVEISINGLNGLSKRQGRGLPSG